MLHSHGFVFRKALRRTISREAHTESRLRLKVLCWLVDGEPGLSSECIAFTCLGINGRIDHPLDGGDFGRCVRLLRDVPELRRRLGRVRKLSPQWARLIDSWAELEKLYDLDVADWPVSHPGTIYPRTGAMMRRMRL